MGLTGMALRDESFASASLDQSRTPCIGIVPWRKVTHREKLLPEGAAAVGARKETQHGLEVLYIKRKANSRESVAIDPNHTHFIMVDNGKDEFGGEIQLRGSIEHALSYRFRVPNVLLVVQVRGVARDSRAH